MNKLNYLLIFVALLLSTYLVSAVNPSNSTSFMAIFNQSVNLNENIISLTSQTYKNTWLNFDGQNSMVQYNDFYNFTMGNFTISFWFNNSLNTSSTKYFLAKYSSTKGRAFSVHTNSGNDVWFQVYANATNSTNYTESRWDNFVDNNVWYHVVLMWNGTGTTIIGNGLTRDADTAKGTPVAYTSANFTLGNAESNLGYFNGSLDDVIIYNRTVTLYEAKAIYAESEHNQNLGRRIPILSYHQIDNGPDVSTVVTLQNFSDQMAYLNSSGITTITISDYYNWTKGNFVMPAKPVILTFDDGFKNVLTNATPIMNLYGFKGVVAVITERVGEDATRMNWTELGQLKSLGWEMVSHTNGSSQLTTFGVSDMINALNISKNEIIGNLSYTPIALVYPGNDHNSSIDGLCAQYYAICFGDASGTAAPYFTYLSSNLTGGINRTIVSNITKFEQFKAAADPYYGVILRSRMNENNGSVIYDASGNNNNGALVSTSWQNDGILFNLTSNIDYTINKITGVYNIVSPVYNYIYNTISLVYSPASPESPESDSLTKTFMKLLVGLFSISIAIVGLGMLKYYYEEGDLTPQKIIGIIVTILIGIIFIQVIAQMVNQL